jgi:hypothetical protein
VVLASAIGLHLPVGIQGASNINVDVTTAYLVVMVNVCMSVFAIAPLYLFVIIYGSFCETLQAWGKHLTLNRKAHASHDFLQDCRSYITGINMANDTFEKQLFIICSSVSIALIITVFRTLSFFFGGYEATLVHIISGVSYSCYGMIFAYILYYLIVMSHHILVLTEELEDVVSNMGLNGTGPMVFDENQQEYVIRKLMNFKGFSALDYFYLDKSLLTSIVANFVTYLIVLIQFRASETTEPP